MTSPYRGPIEISLRDFVEWVASPGAQRGFGPETGIDLVIVDLDDVENLGLNHSISVDTLPCVIVGRTSRPDMIVPFVAGLVDLVVTDLVDTQNLACVGGRSEDRLSAVCDAVRLHPCAATTLALLLRRNLDRSPYDGLWAESTAYAALQGSAEFRAWRARRLRRPIVDGERPRLRTYLDGQDFHVVLTRSHRHNAFDFLMRDALASALDAATASAAARIVLSGEGRSFCSGGDLDEFGTAEDPASAHLIRMAANPSLQLLGLGSRLKALVHGSCIGSGLEMAAFAHSVTAAADTVFALPEVSMGLIPGAGGTVSIRNRIGRHRTAFLGLSGEMIDADLALDWGLIDRIDG